MDRSAVVVVALGALLAGGCSEPQGSASVSATISGERFDGVDAIFSQSRESSGFIITDSHATSLVEVKITDWAGACDIASEQERPRRGAWIALGIRADWPDGGAATLAVGEQSFEAARFSKLDGGCDDVFPSVEGAGTVSLEAVELDHEDAGAISDGELRGSFQLTFGEDVVEGSFRAVFCSHTWYLGGGGDCVSTDS